MIDITGSAPAAPTWAGILLGEPVPPGGPSVAQGAGFGAPRTVHYADIPVDRIRPNPRQPRQVFDEDALAELAASIAEIGLLQPVVVRPDPGDGYQLVAGERRLRCVRDLGWETVPAIIRPTEDADLLRDALLENLHRAALNPLEEAAAYQQLLVDFGCTQEELATRIGRSRPQITNTIRLLKLPPAVQRRVAAGVLSQGHARALLGLPDEASIERIAARIVAEGLSVRSVEELVALGEAPARPAVRRSGRSSAAAVPEIAAELADHLDTRVQVTMGRSKGRIVVEFAGREDLHRIVDLLRPGGTPT